MYIFALTYIVEDFVDNFIAKESREPGLTPALAAWEPLSS